MQLGKVKWFHRNSGYGFIRPKDGSADVFVFHSSIENEGISTLSSGQSVYYESSVTQSGVAATRVLLA